MKFVYPFTTEETPELAQVGGKAMSLITMTQQGLPVPPGFVLTVTFFEPWLEHVKRTPEWARVLNSSPEELRRNCTAVKALCADLELDEQQRETLARALEPLKPDGQSLLVAIRSSSPEEDLEELSFAGGYETTLGVTVETLESALLHSFASCFDERVVVYKRGHGLAVDQPRIAVIVQQQVAAQTAGVAFSLNPLNNSYDEAVINANFGLGESVVSGSVSSDSFTVDKVARAILERKAGKKESSVWLADDGGTYEEPSPAQSQLCLSDEQALKLIDMVIEVEDFYGKPMDIEWAFVNSTLYLLQARPITAYVPLPEDLVTPPGQPKHLYNDQTLIKWGMQEPLSVMGTEYIGMANTKTLQYSISQDIGPDVIDQIRRAVGGRSYVLISNSLKMQKKERVVGASRQMDALTADILAGVDAADYGPKKLPRNLRGIMFKTVRNNLGMFKRSLQAYRKPDEFKQMYLEEVERLRGDLKAETEKQLSMREFAERTMDRMMAYMDVFAPTLIATEIARARMKRLFKGDEQEDKVLYLERALPNNVTIEMGLAMYRLAGFEEIRESTSGDAFASNLEARAFSLEFMAAWDTFMETYGFRGPMEMDPAAPRFYERPVQFFEQLRTMVENTSTESNPQAIFDKAQAERQKAYEELLQAAQKKGKRKANQFAKDYHIFVEFRGLREAGKYYFVLIADMLRKRVLAAAQSLVDADRLDDVEHVFDLKLDELDRGLADPSIDLRALAEKNTRFLKKLQHVREFPRVIDSRGKILRPPKKEAREGELAGEPISTGTIQGKVKVLHGPDEKPVLPGEILVARATDPGWTPLFINAGGVILEVGGMLQHGALVAREYGKPCVAGIENATSILTDGQMVEMDGANGIVRLI
jgi:pyruvate,water dikinase